MKIILFSRCVETELGAVDMASSADLLFPKACRWGSRLAGISFLMCVPQGPYKSYTIVPKLVVTEAVAIHLRAKKQKPLFSCKQLCLNLLFLLEMMGTALPHLGLMQSQQSAREHISPEGTVSSWHPPWSSRRWVEGAQRHWDRQKKTQRWTQARHPLRLFGFPATHADDPRLRLSHTS